MSCNTLEQYKKYIIGCQCSYCLNVSEQTRLNELIKYELSSDYFMSSLPDTDTIWNDIIEYIIDIDTPELLPALPIFSPDYESYNLRDIIHGDPILFSS